MRICSLLRGASSIRSNSFRAEPNSLILYYKTINDEDATERDVHRPVNRFTIDEPAVLPHHLLSISNLIVQHVDVELQLAIDAVPILHHFLLVRAQPQHHQYRQLRVQGQGSAEQGITEERRKLTLVSGCSAVATLPSEDSPSVAIITTAFCPFFLKTSAIAVISITTFLI